MTQVRQLNSYLSETMFDCCKSCPRKATSQGYARFIIFNLYFNMGFGSWLMRNSWNATMMIPLDFYSCQWLVIWLYWDLLKNKLDNVSSDSFSRRHCAWSNSIQTESHSTTSTIYSYLLITVNVRKNLICSLQVIYMNI